MPLICIAADGVLLNPVKFESHYEFVFHKQIMNRNL